MISFAEITKTITVNIATGATVVLFTSWYIWRLREKLKLSYSVTESELFPFQGGQGKYYAIKLTNNGKKLIKNITFSIKDGKWGPFNSSDMEFINRCLR